MKNFTLLFTFLFALTGSFLFSFSANAQLSGSYTIDPTKATSSTNYANFAAAIADLVSGSRTDSGPDQGPGVSGAVTLTAYDTLYRSQQLSIAAISGTSSSNTVTFRSSSLDSSKCILQNASKTGASGDFVLQLNGCDFVTLQGIGFERTGKNTYSTVINIANSSDNCTITNCWLKGRKVPSNSSNGFVYGIGSLIYYTGNGDNTTISNNKMIYGYNGVYSATSSSGNKIIGNILDTIGSSGVYMSNQTGLNIEGNEFNMGDFGPSSGHYVSYGIRVEYITSLVFKNNRMNMMAVNGQVVRAIMLANLRSNTSSSRSLVANNFVTMSGGTGNCTGIALYNTEWVDMFYNNINITSKLKSGACFYLYPQYSNANLRLVNNALVNTGGGFVYSIDGTNTGNLSSIRNNACYHTGTYVGQWNGNDYGTWAQWLSGSRRDTNSVYTDPGFVSATDLHVSNIALNGKAVAYSAVSNDIDGDSRSSSSPDIGADEFFPANLDIGVSKLDSPAAFCAGKYDVKVSFQNFGIDTVKSATINWTVNGTAQKSYSWKGNMAPGSSASGISIGSYSFSANTPYSFKIWTSDPNAKKDGKNINDTLSLTRLTGISGTYTIGKSKTADFKSFNEAITEMTARGLCGATTFNVEDGTYREQITLTQLDGMGSSAPLTFQGASKDSSKVIITLASTTATGTNNAAVQLRGADNTTFKYITFQRTGTNAIAQVIHMLDGAHNNTFSNCAMFATRVTTNNADGINIWSDQSRDTGNVFTNNFVQHGTYNMLFAGISGLHENGTVVSGNVFDSAYASAVQLSYNDAPVISNNVFRTIRNTLTNNASIALIDCDSAGVITGNKLNDRNAENGIYLQGCDARSNAPSTIANNMISREDGRGIYFNGAYNQLTVYNNIYFWGSKTGNSGIASSTSQSGNLYLANNNIHMDSGAVYNIHLKGHLGLSNYNNLYTLSPRAIRFNGRWFKSLTAFNKQTGNDSNSFDVNPYYIGRIDLHTRNTALNGAGTPIPGISTDFDGQLRSATTPDIGADEFDAEPNDVGALTFSSPTTGACEGDQDIYLVIKNFGSKDLKSATIDWEMNGSAQTSYSWTGTLKPLETDTIKLGSGTFKSTQTLKLAATTSSPNGQTDGFTPNDAIAENKGFSGLPLARAGADKITCAGDSVRIGIAGSTNYTYEWFDINNKKAGDGDRVYVKPSSTIKYYQYVTDKKSGCVNTDTLEVVVGALPTINAGTDQSICAGSFVTLGSNGITGNSYAWVTNPSSTFTSSASEPTVSPSSTTTYVLTQTVDATGCTATDDVTITVNPSPTASVVGDTSVCEGVESSYATLGATGNTYSWSITNGSITSGTGTNAIEISWANSGASEVQLIETNSFNCSDTNTVAVVVNANPVSDMVFEGNCAGKDISFEDVSTNGDKRNWDFGNGETSTKKRPNVNFAIGSYTIKLVSSSDAGCTDSTTKTIDIVEAPKADFSLEAEVCAGEDLNITNNSTGTGNNTWTFGDGSSSTDESPSYSYTVAGEYKVKLLMNNQGCKDSTTNKVNVLETPNAAFSLTLEGKTVSVSPIDISQDNYTWDFGDGTTSTKKNESHTYTINEGWVYVTLTITGANGCDGTTTDSAYIEANSIGELPGFATTISLYPNPSNGNAYLQLDLKKKSDLDISLFNLQGKNLGLITSATLQAGNNIIELNQIANGLSKGAYLIQLNFDNKDLYYQVLNVK